MEQWGSEGEIIDYRGNYKPALWSSTVQAFKFTLKHQEYGWASRITDKINFLVRASLTKYLANTKTNLSADSYHTGVTHQISVVDGLNNNHRASISSNSDNCIGFAFNPLLIQMLGVETIENIANIGNKKYMVIFPDDNSDFSTSPNLHLGLTNLYIYTNIIDYGLMGGVQAPFLRHITYNPGIYSSDMIWHEFKQIHYRDIDNLIIFIRGELGDPIQFVSGTCVARLHFKKET